MKFPTGLSTDGSVELFSGGMYSFALIRFPPSFPMMFLASCRRTSGHIVAFLVFFKLFGQLANSGKFFNGLIDLVRRRKG